MRMGVAIELIDDERAEHEEGGGVGPETIAEELDDQEELDYAMTEQIESREGFAADGQMLGGALKGAGDQVATILQELVLGEAGNELLDGGGVDDVEQSSAEDFEERVQAFEDDADAEKPGDAFLGDGHGSPNWSVQVYATGSS